MSETNVSLAKPESPDTDVASTEEPGSEQDQLIRLFVGRNFRKYERVYEASKRKKKAYAFSWCWTAFLMPSAWLLYRKLYIEAAAIFVLPIVIVSLLPGFDAALSGVGVAIAMMAKGYYLTRAQKKIDKITAMPEPEEVKLALLEKAGGVSWPAGIIGFAIYASLIGLLILGAAA